jgi:hypothetical protein
VAPVLQSSVQVSEAFDSESGNPAPVAQPYLATWDTGATNTVITSKVVTELGLKPSGKVKVRGVGPAGICQEHDSNTYLVNILLPNNVTIAGVRVSENAVEGCDVLIGMDVITTGDLAITNHNGRTTFSFRVPPCEEIDFVAEIQEHNRRVGATKTSLGPDEQRRQRNKRKAMRRKGR